MTARLCLGRDFHLTLIGTGKLASRFQVPAAERLPVVRCCCILPIAPSLTMQQTNWNLDLLTMVPHPLPFPTLPARY